MSAFFYLLDTLFLLALLVLPASWLMTPLKLVIGPAELSVSWGLKPLLAPIVLLSVRFGIRRLAQRSGKTARGLWEHVFFRRVSLAIGVTFLFFFGFEQVLELLDFEAKLPPIVIRGSEGEEEPRAKGVIPDPELRWKYNPGVDVHGKVVNSLGFRDREVDPAKTPGTVRVICMGGSCTAHGKVPYSEYVHRLLTNAPPTAEQWEAFNMAVTGYSSVQGLRLFQRSTKQLEPDIVTLYYGWNDHWLGGSVPDSNRMALAMNPFFSTVFEILRKKRFGQFLVYLATPGQNIAVTTLGGCLRVPQDQYRATLTRFVAEIRSIGAVPVVITAPRYHRLTKALVRNGQGNSLEEIIALHDEYVDITREVARDTDTHLLDLVAIFAEEDMTGYYKGDGIHHDKKGRKRVAEELHNKLREIAAGLE